MGDSADNPDMDKTCIITIFDDEYRLLKDNCLVEDSTRIADQRFYSGELVNRNITFARIAASPVVLAAATQAAIDNFSPSLILYSGTAVPLVPFIDNDDIIIANYFFIHTATDSPGLTEEKFNIIDIDNNSIDIVRQAAQGLADRDPQTVFGSIIEAGLSESMHHELKSLIRKKGIMAADNIGAAVAQVCSLNRIPFLVMDIADNSLDSNKPLGIPLQSVQPIEKLFNLKLITLTELARNPLNISF